MKEKVNNQYPDEEIDVKSLLIALWKDKKIIVSITLIFAIFTGVFSMFILPTVYDTKLNIVISMPEKYETKYGEYILPITTNEQYINLITSNDVLINTIADMGYDSEEVSLEKLRKCILINDMEVIAGKTQNSYDITISASDPVESLKLAETLFDNYMEFMDVMITERAVNYYHDDINIKIKTLENSLNVTKENLKRNEELLLQIPQKINTGESNIEIQAQLNDTSDYVIPVDSINPNYIKIENDIVENKQSIINLENTINMQKQFLEELDYEKQTIKNYYETGNAEKLQSSAIDVVETNIYLPSPPAVPTQKSSPNNALNIIIGVAVGGMIGVLFALVKELWFKD